MFHDSVVHEQTLNENFDQIGMKYEENVNFEDLHLKALFLWKMKMEKIVQGRDIKLIKREKSILGKNIKKMRMKKKMGA